MLSEARGNWSFSESSGSAESLHAMDLPPTRSVVLMVPTRPALVLGSTQPDTDVDLSALATLGLERARRRSGGGAVLVSADAVWIDVTLGREDPLWTDDVSRSALWLGQSWMRALSTVGLGRLSVHEGAMVHHELERTVCFAGLAPGEVTDAGGAKVVGISQRRTREGARFQCVAYLRWTPSSFASALTLDDPLARVEALPVRALVGPSAPEWLDLPGATGRIARTLLASMPS